MLKKLITDFNLFVLMAVSFCLRIISLGYSDYQGDEIKALFILGEDQSISEFLLDQRKGPIQFLITFVLKLVDPAYSNEFLIRLPFAIAGILAVYFFYKFLSLIFDKKIAFYASLFMSLNGFFIAFSRIVQYQSFVIMFMCMALYFGYKAAIAKNTDGGSIKYIYISLIAWALSILSHYDGIFIAPMMFYIIFVWFKNPNIEKSAKLKHFILSGTIATALLATFYLPFAYSITESTQQYWQGRLSGDVSAKISSSKYLFSVYHPIYVVHLYTILFVFGTFLFVSSFIRNRFKKYVQKVNQEKIFSPYISGLFLHFNTKSKLWAVIAWFIVPLIFWEKIVYIPGTHIYTYLQPMFVILAFGVLLCEKLIELFIRIEYRKVLNLSWIIVFFGFLFIQSYFVYVENIVEYPWEEEKFLLWTFPKPSPNYHLSMFGFPYNRNWEGIRDYVKTKPEITAYSTNERQTISRYYVPLDKDTDKAGFYIYAVNPQSFDNDILNKKALYWSQQLEPVYTYSRNGETLVRIYEMPVGPLTGLDQTEVIEDE